MFRFTIRDVLWLMVVVGMGCAWLLDGRQRRIDLESCWRHFHEQSSQLEIERARVNFNKAMIELLKTQIPDVTSEQKPPDSK